jgi:4-amino-4-deoxy-L-arabinose transferase-like glycosyltransferase
MTSINIAKRAVYRNMLKSNRIITATYILLFLIAAFFFLFRNTHESIWNDEAFTIALVDHTIVAIWQYAKIDFSPPLYYLMLRLYRLVFGDSVFALRSFSALGAIFLVALSVGPVKRIFGKSVSVIYGFLLIFTPITIAYAQEIRMYIWAAFFVTGSSIYAYLAVIGGKKSDWIKYILFSTAASYTHYYALLSTLVTGSVVIIYILITDRRKIGMYMIAVGIIILLYIPQLYTIFKKTAAFANDFWISEFSIMTVLRVLIFPFCYKYESVPLAIPIFILYLGISIFGLYYSISNKKKNGLMVMFALSVCIMVLLTSILISLVIRPLLLRRYMVPLLGLYLLPLAYGISVLPKRKLVVAITFLYLGLNIPTTVSVYRLRFNGAMKEVVKYIESQNKEKRIFIHVNEHTASTFSYYFPKDQHFLFIDRESKRYTPMEVFKNVNLITDKDILLEKCGTIWLASAIGSYNNSAYNKVEELLNLTESSAETFQFLHSFYAVRIKNIKVKCF